MPATAAVSPNFTLQQRVSYVCSRLLAYGLPVVLFLVACSFYLKTYDSAQIKITFTQVGTIALMMVWLTKMLVDGKLPFSNADLVYVAPFLAFLASGLIAWAHSPFKPWAFEETMRRVFYMVIAMLAVAEIRTNERRTRLWRWLMAAAFVTVGYGVVQYIDSRFFPAPAPGLDPFIWRQAFSKRVFSTFGNPNFYGNFLVIITPMILASVLRVKGSLGRPFLLLVITAVMVVLLDKMQVGIFGGLDPSYDILVGGVIVALLGLFFFYSFWGTSKAGSLPMFLMLFALLFLNLYSTETKGAWVGFTVALAVTVWLIFEYFLHFEERLIQGKTYFPFMVGVGVLFGLLILGMVIAFVVPLLRHTVAQIGFQILWVPTLIAATLALLTMLYLAKKPWNLKKMIYGGLMFFILTMGAIVLQFAKTRLTSVSFRMFTWISTWEMIRTEPVLGHGVGTFKVIYPAYRRPHIIVLEGRSNTETDHSEDEYLETWQDEGIFGFGILLWMISTALAAGLKQLRWYSRLRRPGHHKMLDIDSDPRSYEVLGYLGAYFGALIHWAFDVSIR
ncbi:MAG: O-antigen ligase family protein, partial [Elusimicrobia bacterium]|nr:O-antigen ligase family protein [Elusimicrobiota bacterium]